jgi:DNA-binding SARP family transcriptional activator
MDSFLASFLPDPERRRITLELLDGFRLSCDDLVIDVSSNAQRVLALLGLRPAMSRTAVAGTLWPDGSDARAGANLRNALWRVNRRFSGLILSGREKIFLSPNVEVDIDRLSAVASLIRSGSPSDASVRLGELPAGELLPAWEDDWLLLERERLRQLQLHALTDVARLCMTSGDHSSAVDAALRALRIDGLRESTLRILVKAHVEAGDYAEALRRFHSYRRQLSTELGVAPSPQMLQILQEIPRCQGDPTLPAATT